MLLTVEWSITFKDNQIEDGEVIFLLYETDPRTVENCKRMKAMLGGAIRHDLAGKEYKGGVRKRRSWCS
jgi:hypothetical protein